MNVRKVRYNGGNEFTVMVCLLFALSLGKMLNSMTHVILLMRKENCLWRFPN